MSNYKIFLSCKFPISNAAKMCKEFGKSIGLDIITADRPNPIEIIEKIKEKMFEADAALFLIDDNNQDESFLSDWMKAEYGIAKAMNKVEGIIYVGEYSLISLFPRDIESLVLSSELNNKDLIELTSFLYLFKNKIQRAQTGIKDIVTPPFIRDFLKHRVFITKKGKMKYEAQVQIECLKNGLSDLKHSIHMNYSLCWPEIISDLQPEVKLIYNEQEHKLTIEPIATDKTKFTWKINIEPSLRNKELFTYGWETNFIHYLPLSKAELKTLTSSARYPFPEGQVEHHFFINHPTKFLELKLEFEDGSVIGDCEPKAYIGRTFSKRTEDNTEVERIRNFFKTDNFLNKKEMTLSVENPSLGYNYAILLTLNE